MKGFFRKEAGDLFTFTPEDARRLGYTEEEGNRYMAKLIRKGIVKVKYSAPGLPTVYQFLYDRKK